MRLPSIQKMCDSFHRWLRNSWGSVDNLVVTESAYYAGYGEGYAQAQKDEKSGQEDMNNRCDICREYLWRTHPVSGLLTNVARQCRCERTHENKKA